MKTYEVRLTGLRYGRCYETTIKVQADSEIGAGFAAQYLAEKAGLLTVSGSTIIGCEV